MAKDANGNEIVEKPELNADGTPKDTTPAPKDGNDAVKVPLYKFQKQLDENKELKAKLAKIDADNAASAKKKLEDEGKLKELLDQTTQELNKSKQDFSELTDKQKKTAINQALKVVVAGNNAHDASVVLGLIDKSKLEIEEVDGEVTLKNAEDIVANLKKDKPFLFKDGTPGGTPNNVDPKENGKNNVNADSMRVEFKSLFDKPVLTGVEKKRFTELGKLIQEADKNKK